MPRIINSRLAYDGYAKVSVLTLAADDGTQFHREVVRIGQSACVLPYDADRRVALLVSLPRAPLLVLGGAALVLTVSQLIDAPPAVALGEFDIQTGAWLALAGSALLLAGAFMSVARVSFSVEQRAPRASEAETETVKMPPPDPPA